jgi:NADPH-dependent ferric siderophore reductase
MDAMTDEIPSPPGGDLTTEQILARSPELRRWPLRVESVEQITPRVRQIRLAGPDLADFSYQPGQDLAIIVDTSNSRIIRRRYTIRRFDRAARTLDLNVVAHVDGPGARWARGLRAGDEIEAVGPRGKIFLATQVDWHVFVGDDVAVPAISAMVEGIPADAAPTGAAPRPVRAVVLAEVEGSGERLPIAAAPHVDVEWHWLHRDGRPAGDASALTDALARLALPAGPGYTYVAGETAVVARLRTLLTERGVAPESMSAKAYWGRGKSNASHGEPVKPKP